LTQFIIVQSALVFDQFAEASEFAVIGNDLDQFGEMPRVPFSASHGEGIEIFIQLIQERDTLDDHVIDSIDIEFDLGSRVSVSETSLRLEEITFLEFFDELFEMNSDASDEFHDFDSSLARDAQVLRNGSGKLVIKNTKAELGLLSSTSKVGRKEVLEGIVQHSFRDIIDVFESIFGRSEGKEGFELQDL